MSNSVSLHDLIEALAGAVVDAQDRIEQHQIANLGNYFDEYNRPKSVLMRLPSQHPHASDGDEDIYRAPLLPLVPVNMLKIKDVEITFDVELGNIAEDIEKARNAQDSTSTNETWTEALTGDKRRVSVQTRTGILGRKGGQLHVVMRVEGSDSSDGIARLVNHLVQTQGVVRTDGAGD